MKITKNTLKAIHRRVEKLKLLEAELKKNLRFSLPITRLTILKFLCRDSLAMCEFALFIAEQTQPRIIYKEEDEKMKPLVIETITFMEKIIKTSIDQHQLVLEKEESHQIYKLLSIFRDHQKDYRKVSWTQVRQIKNWQLLLVEQALECFYYPEDPKKGYELARSYTEKYDSWQGTGLINKSFEFVKDIRFFWEMHYLHLVEQIESA